MARMFVAGMIVARVIDPGLLVPGMVVARMALLEFRRSLVIPFRVHIVNLYPLGV